MVTKETNLSQNLGSFSGGQDKEGSWWGGHMCVRVFASLVHSVLPYSLSATEHSRGFSQQIKEICFWSASPWIAFISIPFSFNAQMLHEDQIVFPLANLLLMKTTHLRGPSENHWKIMLPVVILVLLGLPSATLFPPFFFFFFTHYWEVKFLQILYS